jgi:hypothetical protein
MGWLLIIVGIWFVAFPSIKNRMPIRNEKDEKDRVLLRRTGWLLRTFGVFAVIGGIAVLGGPHEQHATTRQPAGSPPQAAISIPAPPPEKKEAPLPAYTVKGPSAYGAPGVGKIGNNYWISIPGDPPEPTVRRVVQFELNKRRMEMVVYQDGSAWRPTELSFFVYTRPSDFTKQPKVPGEEAADYV